MDFLNLCKERYSVRQYDSRPVENDKLMMVLEAGRLAPTACNYQPQRIHYAFGLPENIVVSFLLDIGYPASINVNRHTPRKELSATVTEL